MKNKNTAIAQKQKTQVEPEQYTWIAQISNMSIPNKNLPKGYRISVLQRKDKSKLSELYFASYNQKVVKSPEEAKIEIERDFHNEYGILDYSASFLIFHNNIAVAAILLVEQAPWEDTPSCPFITQLMVHPDHRKLGLAQYLLNRSANILVEKRTDAVALRVMSNNIKALNLYHKCGFVSWLEPLK